MSDLCADYTQSLHLMGEGFQGILGYRENAFILNPRCIFRPKFAFVDQQNELNSTGHKAFSKCFCFNRILLNVTK